MGRPAMYPSLCTTRWARWAAPVDSPRAPLRDIRRTFRDNRNHCLSGMLLFLLFRGFWRLKKGPENKACCSIDGSGSDSWCYGKKKKKSIQNGPQPCRGSLCDDWPPSTSNLYHQQSNTCSTVPEIAAQDSGSLNQGCRFPVATLYYSTFFSYTAAELSMTETRIAAPKCTMNN